MEKLIAITTLVIICLVSSVESTDSNTAVDLRNLAQIMCTKKKTHYISGPGYRKFCKAAKDIICPGVLKNHPVGRCVLSTGPRSRLTYMMKKVAKNVCFYEGRDEATKKVRKHLDATSFCKRYDLLEAMEY